MLAGDVFCLKSINDKNSFACEFLFFKKNSQGIFYVAVPYVSFSSSTE